MLRQGPNYAPDLYACHWRGERLIVKDYAAKAWIWRHLLGRFLIRREARALRSLAGLEGIPQYRGCPDALSLVMTAVPGEPLHTAAGQQRLGNGFMTLLEDLVAEMHRRGVVHLDLQHRGNILVSADGRPGLLDFTSALRFRTSWWGGRWAVRVLGRFDHLALIKWKARLAPRYLTREEARWAQLLRRVRSVWLPRRLMDAFFDTVRREES